MDALVITDEERALRIEAVDYARASVRLEGFVLDDTAEALFARYIDGELTRAQLNAEVARIAALQTV